MTYADPAADKTGLFAQVRHLKAHDDIHGGYLAHPRPRRTGTRTQHGQTPARHPRPNRTLRLTPGVTLPLVAA